MRLLSLPNIFKGDYKRLLIAPAIVVALSLVLILVYPGVPAGIELKGGTLLTVYTTGSFDPHTVEAGLKAELGVKEVSVRPFTNPQGQGAEIEIEANAALGDAETALKAVWPLLDERNSAEVERQYWEQQGQSANSTAAAAKVAELDAKIKTGAESVLVAAEKFIGPQSRPTEIPALVKAAEDAFSKAKDGYRTKILAVIQQQIQVKDYTFKDVGPSLSSFFLTRAREVVIYSLILSAVLIFFVFRKLIPSVAVMSGAAFDIVAAMGAMAAFQIPLTLPSLATLLMLIGYSLDTDVLLTIRVLKRAEMEPRERAYGAMRTGITMSIASIFAFGVLLVLSLMIQVPTYYQIATVAMCGLLADMVGTWFLNAPVVLWYAERKMRKVHG